VAASVALTVGNAQAATDPYKRALALERQGRVEAALALLEGKRLPKPEARHRDRLRALVAALAANAVFTNEGEYALARAVLDRVEKRLKPIAELPLLEVVYRREAQLSLLMRQDADAEAAAAIAKAKALEKDGKHKEAAAVYKSVAEMRPGAVSPRLRSSARVGELHEEAAAATEHKTWLARLEKWLAGVSRALLTVLIWIIYGAIALVVVALLYGLHRLLRALPPRKGTTLSVEDLSAAPADRTTKSYVLARELLAEIRGAGTAGGLADGVDEARDLDGSTASAPLPRVADEGVAKFVALMDDETPLRVGPFSFSPRQIVYLVAPFLRRRARRSWWEA
jgi:tetratricopeptide (TPR) repeat protein